VSSVAGNKDFIKSILCAITTSPDLADFYASLVLKGGVALSLKYESDRLSIGDMDFGLTQKGRQITQDDFDTLMAELDDWGVAIKGGGSRNLIVKGDGIDTPVITYVHPGTRETGELVLQVNANQAPPVLTAEMEDQPLENFSTWDGKPFSFRVMRLEEIAAEKMCRLWRPDKRPPRAVDLYDLGYCREQPDFDYREVVKVVRRHRKEDSEGHLIKIKDAMPEVRNVARDRSGQVVTARATALFGVSVTNEDINKRVASGLALLVEVAKTLGTRF
jgi:predicted nucleotidyltransferase component of viral defense system